jgi:hypothetical protein
MAKEETTHPQNIPAAASQCWQCCDVSRWLNSVCGLNFHLSHHDTESTELKRISDVVKETLAKKGKEFKSNLQNKPATAH